MPVHDALAFLLVDLGRPHIAFRGAAEDDAVTARHHVNAEAGLGRLHTGSAACRVFDFGLRHEHRQLALEGHELVITEQRLGPEARAVDDDRLRQRRDLVGLLELPDDDRRAEDLHVLEQRLEVNRRLDAHLGPLDGEAGGEGMFAGLEQLARALNVRRQQHVAAPGHLLIVRGGVVGDPRDAVLGADEQLQAAVGDVDGLLELGGPLGGADVSADEARGRREAGQRPVRGDLGGQGRRIDGDAEAAPLQFTRGRETDDAAADDGDGALALLQGQVGRHGRRAPRERHARSTVAVVVNQQLAAELVGPQDEAARAMGAEADRGADDAVPRRMDARQHNHGSPRRSGDDRGRAGCAGRGRHAQHRQASRLDEITTLHGYASARDDTRKQGRSNHAARVIKCHARAFLPEAAGTGHERGEKAGRMERETGIEPATNSLGSCDSTTELLPLVAATLPV